MEPDLWFENDLEFSIRSAPFVANFSIKKILFYRFNLHSLYFILFYSIFVWGVGFLVAFEHGSKFAIEWILSPSITLLPFTGLLIIRAGLNLIKDFFTDYFRYDIVNMIGVEETITGRNTSLYYAEYNEELVLDHFQLLQSITIALIFFKFVIYEFYDAIVVHNFSQIWFKGLDNGYNILSTPLGILFFSYQGLVNVIIYCSSILSLYLIGKIFFVIKEMVVDEKNQIETNDLYSPAIINDLKIRSKYASTFIIMGFFSIILIFLSELNSKGLNGGLKTMNLLFLAILNLFSIIILFSISINLYFSLDIYIAKKRLKSEYLIQETNKMTIQETKNLSKSIDYDKPSSKGKNAIQIEKMIKKISLMHQNKEINYSTSVELIRILKCLISFPEGIFNKDLKILLKYNKVTLSKRLTILERWNMIKRVTFGRNKKIYLEKNY